MESRITINQKICHGKPCFRGTRIMVSQILELLAYNTPIEEILKDFPALTPEDIKAALLFASEYINDDEIYVNLDEISVG